MENQYFISAEAFAAPLIPLLKKLGFRKRKLTWYKDNEDATVIFHIQKSQYGSNVWYYCFGTDIFQLSGLRTRTMDGCQVRDRYNQCENNVYLTTEKLAEMIITWEQEYGTVEALLQRLQEHRLPYMTFASAVRFLAVRSGMTETEFDAQAPRIYGKYKQDIHLPKLHTSVD